MKPQRVAIIGVGILAVAAGVWAIAAAVDRVANDAMAPYRAETAGELVVQYLETHNNEWPPGWEALVQDAPATYEGEKWLASVREHVAIDFTFRPESIDFSREWDRSQPPFRAVWLKNGVEISPGEGPDPNTIIFRYLERSLRASDQED